jgi:hypothetical protein
LNPILDARTASHVAPWRRVSLAGGCAAILFAVACRMAEPPAPLREDPVLAAELAEERRARSKESSEARIISADQAKELEALLERNPEDEETRAKLLRFYQWNGKNTQSWNDNVAARRRHALWLTRHHPDGFLVAQVRLSQRTDPVGYAQAKQLWLVHTKKADASARVLDNAALFFQESEKSIAGALLLRAQALEPDGPSPRMLNGRVIPYYPSWSARLGALYAAAIIEAPERAVVTAKPDEIVFMRDGSVMAEQMYPMVARSQLDASNDPALLAYAGQGLSMAASNPTLIALARRYLQRALELDPQQVNARRNLDRLDLRERNHWRPPSPFAASSRESWPAIVAKMPEDERLAVLPCVAEWEYRHSESLDYRTRTPSRPKDSEPEVIRKNTQESALSLTRAKAYAREAVELASRKRGDPAACDAVYRANLVLALIAFREGHQQAAVRYMLEASKAPAPANRATRSFPGEFEGKLTNDLLKHGERESVAEYLERASEGRYPDERDRMRKEAGAIRAGQMPERYQRLLADGSI